MVAGEDTIYLQEKFRILADKLDELDIKGKKFDDDDIRSNLAELSRCLQKIKKIRKLIFDTLGIEILPYCKVYMDKTS